MSVRTEQSGPVTTVILSRPARRNAVDRDTADALIARLERVRTISHSLAYGVGDDMDSLLADHTGN